MLVLGCAETCNIPSANLFKANLDNIPFFKPNLGITAHADTSGTVGVRSTISTLLAMEPMLLTFL